MREVDRQPRDAFLSGPMDRIAGWLNHRTHAEAWVLVATSASLAAVVDISTVNCEQCTAPLYIIPICLACWMFQLRESIATATAVTLISSSTYPLLRQDWSTLAMIENGTTLTISFLMLTAIMLAFRRVYYQAQLAAIRDRMTGALNKEAFHERATAMLDMAYVTKRTVLLAYLDLDGFKAVNDRKGHHVGDEVLQAFSAGVARGLRRDDCFGRMGGDEFAVGMLIGPDDEAQDLAERLHQRFSAALAASGHAVTCSMGALIVPPGARHVCAELIRTTDRIMYSAKHSGKNAVRIATAIPEIGNNWPCLSSLPKAGPVKAHRRAEAY